MIKQVPICDNCGTVIETKGTLAEGIYLEVNNGPLVIYGYHGQTGSLKLLRKGPSLHWCSIWCMHNWFHTLFEQAFGDDRQPVATRE